MRVMLRRLFPSTNAATICARFAVLNLFILIIMLETSAGVNTLNWPQMLPVWKIASLYVLRNRKYITAVDGRDARVIAITPQYNSFIISNLTGQSGTAHH
jgi:hypothetical protein